MWKDDGPAPAGRPRVRRRRPDPDRRSRGQRRAPGRARRGDGLPELRALSALLGLRQHRLPAAHAIGRPRRDRIASHRCRAAPRSRRSARAEAGPAFRRTAAARGARAGARAQPRGLSDGRAAVEPRRAAAPADANGSEEPSAGIEDHDGVRDARSGRGDDAGLARCDHAARTHRPDRPATGAVSQSQSPLRRDVSRQPGDEYRGRDAVDRSRRSS